MVPLMVSCPLTCRETKPMSPRAVMRAVPVIIIVHESSRKVPPVPKMLSPSALSVFETVMVAPAVASRMPPEPPFKSTGAPKTAFRNAITVIAPPSPSTPPPVAEIGPFWM
jgi:hypothetical protein